MRGEKRSVVIAGGRFLYYVGDGEPWRILNREIELSSRLLGIADRKSGSGMEPTRSKGGHLVGAPPHPWGVRGLPEKGPGPIFEVSPGPLLYV